MTRQKPSITVDTRQFMLDAQKLVGKDYPKAVALAFRKIAQDSRDEVREEARRKFHLHTEYIPNGVLSTPHKPAQIQAAARSIEKYHDLEAAVFLRPASSPQRSLGFMVPHEEGGTKRGLGNSLAIPAGGIENYSFKTGRGAVKSAWKPKKLLQEYNTLGGNVKGNKLRKGRRSGKGVPFLKKTKSGTTMLVRRKNLKGNSLEFLYSFKDSARVRPVWGFEATVDTTVRNTYKHTASRYLGKLGR